MVNAAASFILIWALAPQLIWPQNYIGSRDNVHRGLWKFRNSAIYQIKDLGEFYWAGIAYHTMWIPLSKCPLSPPPPQEIRNFLFYICINLLNQIYFYFHLPVICTRNIDTFSRKLSVLSLGSYLCCIHTQTKTLYTNQDFHWLITNSRLFRKSQKTKIQQNVSRFYLKDISYQNYSTNSKGGRCNI